MHTSAKARLASVATSVPSSGDRFMSVNHFPYLPVVTNPKNIPCIQTVIRIATKFNHFFHRPITSTKEDI